MTGYYRRLLPGFRPSPAVTCLMNNTEIWLLQEVCSILDFNNLYWSKISGYSAGSNNQSHVVEDVQTLMNTDK